MANIVQLSCSKYATRQQRYFHSAEIVLADNPASSNKTLRRRKARLTENVNASGRSQTGQGWIIFHAHRTNARNPANPCQKLIEEIHLESILPILSSRQ